MGSRAAQQPKTSRPARKRRTATPARGRAREPLSQLLGFMQPLAPSLNDQLAALESFAALAQQDKQAGISPRMRSELSAIAASARALRTQLSALTANTPPIPTSWASAVKMPELVKAAAKACGVPAAHLTVGAAPPVMGQEWLLTTLLRQLFTRARNRASGAGDRFLFSAGRAAGDAPGLLRYQLRVNRATAAAVDPGAVRRSTAEPELTLARRIVEFHGGALWREAGPRHEVINFTLPEVSPQLVTSSPPASEVADLDLVMPPMSILLAAREDEAVLYRKYLKHPEIGEVTCDVAGSYREAVGRVGEKRYGLVVVDVDLPDGSGVDLVRKLSREKPDLAILMIGNRGKERLAVGAMQAGAMDCVTYDHLLPMSLPRSVASILERQSIKRMSGQLKVDFIGMVGHDLKNPVGNILSYSEVLLDNPRSPLSPEQNTVVSRIRKNALFTLELIADILDIVKIESGKFPLSTANHDMRALLRESLETTMALALEKQIRLVPVLPNHPVNVMVDRSKIIQVINNFVSNAIKFSNPHTVVELGCSATEDRATIWVKDQGQGIPLPEVPKLFQKFAKTSVRSTRGEKGTGLGLYIVSEIVKIHEGEIEVDTAPGAGSCFKVHLPIF